MISSLEVNGNQFAFGFVALTFHLALEMERHHQTMKGKKSTFVVSVSIQTLLKLVHRRSHRAS
jgi:hypothetical protein